MQEIIDNALDFLQYDLFDGQGKNLNPVKYTLVNDDTRRAFEDFVENVQNIDPNAVFEITGGDRYIDSNGNIRSSTNHQIIPDAEPRSYHNINEGVDFGVSTTATDSQMRSAAIQAGFIEYDSKYADGHIHVGGI